VEPPMPDPKPKKCSEGIPCTQYYDLDDYEDHPDCGESDYGTSVCEPDGYNFFYHSHYHPDFNHIQKAIRGKHFVVLSQIYQNNM
jgi:hypothetical protein